MFLAAAIGIGVFMSESSTAEAQTKLEEAKQAALEAMSLTKETAEHLVHLHDNAPDDAQGNVDWAVFYNKQVQAELGRALEQMKEAPADSPGEVLDYDPGEGQDITALSSLTFHTPSGEARFYGIENRRQADGRWYVAAWGDPDVPTVECLLGQTWKTEHAQGCIGDEDIEEMQMLARDDGGWTITGGDDYGLAEVTPAEVYPLSFNNLAYVR
jgi:hypothetical protein